MKIVLQNIIPIKGFSAMAIYPLIFIRKDWWEKATPYYKKTTINHELIHFEQQKELLFIGFYLLYLYYWIKKGYRGNPFEKEAYAKAASGNYLIYREKFAWKGYK